VGAAAVSAVVVGAGCSRGCGADELLALIDGALAAAGATAEDVRALATVDVKADEPGLREAARRRGWPLRTHPASALSAVTVPTPSPVVAAHVGTPSVAEAAALLTAGAAGLLVTKRRSANATCALAAMERR
jgi:cobalt-precorrin 5A hydrolase/precorrin-3B C17-methyltransferase